jgi:hypothetical protein
MPTFRTLPPVETPPAPGIYVGKIIKALERTSENGNPMLILRLQLPDGKTLPSILTFVKAAEPVINAFCQSAELLRPSEPNIEVDLRPDHCLNRYIYFRLEHDEDGASRITRFIDRQAALAANPRLADIKLGPQQPLALPIVRKPSL